MPSNHRRRLLHSQGFIYPEIASLDRVLDRFLVHGQTTTSIVQSSPVPPRSPRFRRLLLATAQNVRETTSSSEKPIHLALAC